MKAAQAVLLFSISLAYGCGEVDKSQHTYPLYEAVGGGYCEMPEHNMSIPPSEAEIGNFESRSRKGLVVWPLDISCVERSYSESELRNWSDRGDVVSKFTLLVREVINKDYMCKNEVSILGRLEDISDVKVVGGGESRYRVPEAFYLMSVVRQVCGHDDWKYYVENAPSRGLELSVVGSWGY